MVAAAPEESFQLDFASSRGIVAFTFQKPYQITSQLDFLNTIVFLAHKGMRWALADA